MSTAAHLNQEGVTVNKRFDCLEEYFISLFNRVSSAFAKRSFGSITIFVHNQSHLLGSGSWDRELELLLTSSHEVITEAKLPRAARMRHYRLILAVLDAANYFLGEVLGLTSLSCHVNDL